MPELERERQQHLISFEDDARERPAVAIADGTELMHALDIHNSPILFGCRTGICGACVIEVLEVTEGRIPAPAVLESESLDLYAPGNPRARLACQMKACASMKIRKVKPL